LRGLKGALFDGLWTLVVVGILALLLYLKAFGLVAGLAAGLLTGLAAGLLALVAVGRTEVGIVSSPRLLAKQCLRDISAIALATGLLAGLATGLFVGELSGLRVGLLSGLAYGLIFGLLAGLCGDGYVWLRYAIAVRAAARLDWLPKRPSLFLDWCVHTGLMRMAGSSLQFRHRQLQDWLISSAERAAQAESRARQRLAAARH
jgi:hypothetical protein